MDLQYVRRVLKMFSESNVDELEIEDETSRIHMVRHRPGVVHAPMPAPAPVATPAFPAPSTETPAAAQVASESHLHQLRSPIVGTFYRASSPDAEPFVAVGQTVQPGQTVCIIEAMKIWNEIESEISGRIVRILVENAQAVEYNQPLFLIEPL